jgi:hypothetical protein
VYPGGVRMIHGELEYLGGVRVSQVSLYTHAAGESDSC